MGVTSAENEEEEEEEEEEDSGLFMFLNIMLLLNIALFYFRCRCYSSSCCEESEEKRGESSKGAFGGADTQDPKRERNRWACEEGARS